MAIHLSDHFTLTRLIRFTLPSIGTMLTTSLYSVVDGFFVSNYVGKSAFAAITLIFPLLCILGASGLMFGAGGSALVAKRLGEGKKEEANKIFSLLVYATLVLGLLLALLGAFFVEPTARFLGAEGEILAYAVLYGRISLLSLSAFMLQFFFQALFVTAEKPKLGFLVTLLAGATNVALDALFILFFSLGLTGAALATVLSECVGGLFPLWYFARKNSSLLRLTFPSTQYTNLLTAAANGFSEFLVNTCYPLLTALYTYTLFSLVGEDGVAALGVLLYVSFVFSSFFLGYATGSAPLISYNLGARKYQELRSLLGKSIVLNLVAGLALSLLAFSQAERIASIFTGYDPALVRLTSTAITVYAPVFLLAALNIYGSSFFTAMNNGLLSALLAVLRTLVFGVPALFLLPHVLGVTGVWLSWSVAEAATLAITLLLFHRVRVTWRNATHEPF